jgi:hypothetical protein
MLSTSTKFILSTIAVSSFLFLGSCDKKGGCTDVRAENFDPTAEVEDGSCISQREKFIGVYQGNVLCIQPPNGTFQSEVRPANDNLNDIFIDNLGGRFQNPTRATIDRNTITIARQDPDAVGFYVTGSGNIIGNVITISFETQSAGVTNACVYTMEK